jgi:hypothetical protein
MDFNQRLEALERQMIAGRSGSEKLAAAASLGSLGIAIKLLDTTHRFPISIVRDAQKSRLVRFIAPIPLPPFRNLDRSGCKKKCPATRSIAPHNTSLCL